MRLLILLLFMVTFAQGSALDEYNFYKANKYYLQGEYKKALELYRKIEPKSDRVYYNIANTLYRLKEYQKAIEYYQLVVDASYNAKKLYNIGNAYVKQKNYLKAIIFYKNALKFTNDQRVKDNLLYAQTKNRALQSVILKGAKCYVTKGELLNFDDENVSKDMQLAKYKNESKFNVVDIFKERERDLVEQSDVKVKEKNTTEQKRLDVDLIISRTKEKLKERSSKVLLIPVGEKK